MKNQRIKYKKYLNYSVFVIFTLLTFGCKFDKKTYYREYNEEYFRLYLPRDWLLQKKVDSVSSVFMLPCENKPIFCNNIIVLPRTPYSNIELYNIDIRKSLKNYKLVSSKDTTVNSINIAINTYAFQRGNINLITSTAYLSYKDNRSEIVFTALNNEEKYLTEHLKFFNKIISLIYLN